MKGSKGENKKEHFDSEQSRDIIESILLAGEQTRTYQNHVSSQDSNITTPHENSATFYTDSEGYTVVKKGDTIVSRFKELG